MKITYFPDNNMDLGYIPVFFDIETNGKSAYDSVITCYAFKVYREKPIVKSGENEKELIEGLLGQFQMIKDRHPNCVFTGYFTSGFDMKFIVSRSLYHGIVPKILRYIKHIDMYYVVMNMFSYRQSAKKIAKKFGIEHDDVYSGKDMIVMYNAKRFDKIEEHCRKDVELLEKIYDKVKPLFDYVYWTRYGDSQENKIIEL